MLSNLPVYKITISDEFSEGVDLGISQIAFVKNPAVLIKGVAFNEVSPKKQYFGDKIKYRIVSPAMIPMQIYRADDESEYYVEFTEQEIERIHSKFMKNISNRKVFNLEHDKTQDVPAYILEAWIVGQDPTKDKSFSEYGIQVPKGTLMITSQITNKDTYNSLIENEQTGFSIEGFLGMTLSEIINKKNLKETKMEENKMQLPAGEYIMGDKIYIVKEDGTFEIKDKEVAKEEMAADEPKEEAKAEEVKKEEMAEEVLPVDEEPAADGDFYSKAEVDAKFEELYQMIAEMKNEEIAEDVIEEKVLPQQMSAIQKRTFSINALQNLNK